MEDLTFAVVLTAAGATASAALITGLIAIAKQLVVIGPWIQADREPTIAFALSALLVTVAVLSVGVFTPDGPVRRVPRVVRDRADRHGRPRHRQERDDQGRRVIRTCDNGHPPARVLSGTPCRACERRRPSRQARGYDAAHQAARRRAAADPADARARTGAAPSSGRPTDMVAAHVVDGDPSAGGSRRAAPATSARSAGGGVGTRTAAASARTRARQSGLRPGFRVFRAARRRRPTAATSPGARMSPRAATRSRPDAPHRLGSRAEEAPDQLARQPAQLADAPAAQRKALRGALDTVGWVQQVIVNRRTGHVVDGHARIEEALSRHEPAVPVLYVDLSPEEEALVLATLDPIAAMAQADDEKLRACWPRSPSTTRASRALLADLAGGEPSRARPTPTTSPSRPPSPGQARRPVRARRDHRILCGDATSRPRRRLLAGAQPAPPGHRPAVRRRAPTSSGATT